MSSTSALESSTKKLEDGIHVYELDSGIEKPHLYNPHVDVSDVDERKLMRKVDMRTIPWLTLLYLLCFLDRTSIGNAKVVLRHAAMSPVSSAHETRLPNSCTTWSKTSISLMTSISPA